MRVGIDARYLSHGLMGGVHTFVAELIPAMIDAAPEIDFYLYADRKNTFELDQLPANVTVRYLPYERRFSSVHNDLIKLRQSMAADDLDVVHFPANYGFAPAGVRTVITLHDQINILPLREIIRGHPKKLKVLGMMTYLHLCSSRTVNQADLIVTVSEYSRQQILNVLDFDPERVLAAPHGLPSTSHYEVDQTTLDDVRTKFRLHKPFVIADGLKNPAVLVDAWKNLPAYILERHQIVFFSRIPTPPDAVQQAVDAGYARLLVRPSNEELKALYTMARALAFPSWIEGFGFPILEAMSCGTPVIASDRGSIPEVVGDAGLLCDVEDVDAFARNLTTVLCDPQEHSRLQQLGYQRASEFSWDRTARMYLEFYQRAAGREKAGH
ncbi:MAG: glycosyl transferase family 1 [Anaerolineaceae bacterium]|nr:glycosyl transferase family 1 [Anaerolineaceae bacterium]